MQTNDLDLIGSNRFMAFMNSYVLLVAPAIVLVSTGLIIPHLFVLGILAAAAYALADVTTIRFNCITLKGSDGNAFLRVVEQKSKFKIFFTPIPVMFNLKRLSVILRKRKGKIIMLLSDGHQEVLIAKADKGQLDVVQRNAKDLAKTLGLNVAI